MNGYMRKIVFLMATIRQAVWLLDRVGNVYVGGVFNTGNPSQAGQGLKLGVMKYSPEGTKIWRRIVEDSGPTVVLEGSRSIIRGTW